MPDVFISYSSQDEKLARWLYKSCENLNISAFLASISISPGTKWKKAILDNLRAAKWFFFLATPNSIRSENVRDEVRGALALKKEIIPILYKIDFKDLPEWIREYQGVKITDTDASQLNNELKRIARRITLDSVMTGIIITGFIMAAAYASRE